LIGREKRRIDNYLNGRIQDQKNGRRNSYSNIFSTQNFYHYIRIQADHIFIAQTSTPVKNISRIRSIQETISFM